MAGGSFYLDAVQARKLDELLGSVPNLENYEIGIFSHTDNIGGEAYNKWLSQMRSEAVVQALERRNVPRQLIKVKDWGQENPLYSNATFEGREGNRRVDVLLWPLTF